MSDLGVTIDSQLTMSGQLAALSRSCFYRLRQLRAVRNSLTIDAAKALVNAFISSRLDYCNSLLAGVGEGLLSKLQSIQNAAARFITRTRKFEHISPVLRDLHWLPIRQRIDFKVATLVHKCLNGTAPSYLADDCIAASTVSGRRHLRSADTGTLLVPRVQSKYGSRSFAVYGPTIWNSLPNDLRTAGLSTGIFRRS